MVDWFESLNLLQQIFSLIAIPSTLIMVFQLILMLLGIGDGDGDGGYDHGGFDHEGTDHSHSEISDDGLALFSFRGIMAFLCVGGWSGMAFAGTEMNNILAILLSFVCGASALFLMAFMIKGILKLQSSGNIDLANAIGKVGQVYIPIPANSQGQGKITIVVQGSFSEISAITNESDQLKTGEAVRVVATDETGLLVVERVRR